MQSEIYREKLFTLKQREPAIQGKRMPLKIKTICRHCERSEAIQFGFLTKHRYGLLHYVRNDGNQILL